eukprot:366239-Chlamydomonas_euryale.AAC.30
MGASISGASERVGVGEAQGCSASAVGIPQEEEESLHAERCKTKQAVCVRMHLTFSRRNFRSSPLSRCMLDARAGTSTHLVSTTWRARACCCMPTPLQLG